MTELTDHIRLLFAKIGQLHCQQCGRTVQRSHAGSIVTSLLQHAAGQAIMLSFPYARTGSQTSEAIRVELQRLGFTRLLVAGQVVRLDVESLLPEAETPFEVLVDRLVVQADRRARLLDSLERALRFGARYGCCAFPDGRQQKFSQHLHCRIVILTYRDPVPNVFSFLTVPGRL
jgi:excinuclease ABC subunit A